MFPTPSAPVYSEHLRAAYEESELEPRMANSGLRSAVFRRGSDGWQTLSDSDEIVEMLDGEFGQEHLANVWYSGHYHAAAIYSNTQPPDPTPKCA